MTTEVITLAATCLGGGHLTFALTGAKVMTVRVELETLSAPLSDDDAEVFCRVIAKMAKAGRTVAQARTLLQAGVTVIV